MMREVEMAMRGRVVDGRGWEGGLTIRSASALRFSKGCSSLNLDRMVTVMRLVMTLVEGGG
jgi:hypothetical protein